MYLSNDQLSVPDPESLETYSLIIQIAGRGTTVSKYDIPADVGMFWAEIGDSMLNWHLINPTANIPSHLREKADYERYLLTADKLVLSEAPISGVRIEHGFRAWVGNNDESFDATFHLLDEHANDLGDLTPTAVFPNSDRLFINGQMPTSAVLIVQTQEYGNLSYVVSDGRLFDLTRVKLEVAEHDGWPIATKVFYDNIELEAVSSSMLPYGPSHTQVALYGG